MNNTPSPFTTSDAIRRYALAGRAVFTLVSKRTGTRFTYRVTRSTDDSPRHFVSVLTGPDQYTYLGTVFEKSRYEHGRKSTIGTDAPSAQAFDWFWNVSLAERQLGAVEVYHAGRCGRCGRELTTVESVTLGLGPVCATKEHR